MNFHQRLIMKEKFKIKASIIFCVCLCIIFVSGCEKAGEKQNELLTVTNKQKSVTQAKEFDKSTKEKESRYSYNTDAKISTSKTFSSNINKKSNYVPEKNIHKEAVNDQVDLFSDALSGRIKGIHDSTHSIHAIVHAITNNYISAEAALNSLVLTHNYTPSNAITVCNTILNHYVNLRERDLANTVSIKNSALRDLKKYDESINLCTNVAKTLQSSSPYGTSLLMIAAGTTAKKMGLSAGQIYKFYEEARYYCDPRRYKDSNNSNFGCASCNGVRALYNMKQYEKAIDLIDDTLPILNKDNSWVASLKSLRSQCIDMMPKNVKGD